MNAAYTLMKSTTLYVNVDNVFNRKPVIDMRAGDPPLRGRTLRAQVEYKF
jgi:outer membrane receptor protein involved in Fe transport